MLSLHKVVESRLGYVVTPLLVTFLAVLIETLRIYSFVLIVRVLLSWFPNLDWSNPILSTVSSITDPYLNAFRGLIPPIGGIDLSAILAFVALNVMQWLLGNSIYAFSQLSMGL